jgi:F5/8 type C domain
MLRSSALDLVDLHLYPGVGHDLDQQVHAIGLSDTVRKPVMMGEFGAFRFAYANPQVGAYALAHWQADSCAFGFAGWLVWLWSTSDGEVYGAREGGDAIAALLSPVQRPDPCSAAGVPTNVAPSGTATASASLADQPPELAIEGLADTQWGAGDFPPQWIQIDLGAARAIRQIDLLVGQYPAGETDHRLLLAGDDGVFSLVAEFVGVTAQGDVLTFLPAAPLVARYVRVETAVSPSWVAWPEIQVYA